jgi:carbon storage regulator CsrA
MLVLARKENQSIAVDQEITVKVLEIKGGQVSTTSVRIYYTLLVPLTMRCI